MTLNIYLVVLTFIVLIVVIYLAENITSAVLIISLMANFLIISSQLSSIEMPTWTITSGASNSQIETSADTASSDDEPIDHHHMYGPAYDEYHVNHTTYTTAYEEPKHVITSSSDTTNGADAANAIMAQRRARDKKCIDGAVSKTSDYYKQHFNDELERSEAKDWRSAYEW